MTPEQLKASILQYAMEGKLVKQDPNDEPASVLLEKIKAEKKKLVKEGKIKKSKKLPPVKDDEKPFEIPDSWKWVRLAHLFLVKGGKRVPKGMKLSDKPEKNSKIYIRVADMKNNTIDYSNLKYATQDIVKQISKYTISAKDLYFSIAGSIGKVGTIPQNLDNSQLTENAAKLVPIFVKLVFKNYFLYCLQSNVVVNQYNEIISKVAQPKLALRKIRNLFVPLPPLNEQRRIVAKIEKLMPLVDKYAEAYNRLKVIDDSFDDKLKQSILQYAMEGKLVKQDPNDEPASVLLKKINTEKEKLVKAGKIKKSKKLPPIKDSEKPFKIPASWEWVRLGNICNYIQRGKSPKYDKVNKNHPVIAQKCNQWSGISLEKAKFLTNDFWEKLEAYRFIKVGDVLLNSTGLGTVGRVNILSKPMNKIPVDSHVTIIRSNKYVESSFILFYMMSPQIQNNLKNYLSGSTKQKEFSRNTVLNLIVPLPPFNEQKRIIAKIEELFRNIKGFN